MIITTPRLTLRPLRRDDIEAMAQWRRQPDPLDEAWNWPHTLQAAGTTDLWFAIYTLDDRRREWAIVRENAIIGHIGLRQIDEAERSARLGMLLGCTFRGQGYGDETLRGFLDAFFGPLGFSLLRLDVAAYNVVALRLYERIGFRRTGTLWHPLDLLDPAVLADPRYNPIRQYLRHNEHGVAAHHITMELRREGWRVRSDA
jgi:RimJ/RimL family protein N-acetyltransferase